MDYEVEAQALKKRIVERRRAVGADAVKGEGKCLWVNLEIARRLNENPLPGTEAHCWEDVDFNNFTWKDKEGFHVVGTYKATNGHWLGFDGTADQVKGQAEPILIVQGASEEEVLEKLNMQLKGDFRISKAFEPVGRKVDAR